MLKLFHKALPGDLLSTGHIFHFIRRFRVRCGRFFIIVPMMLMAVKKKGADIETQYLNEIQRVEQPAS
jgi:hypothetical protein